MTRDPKLAALEGRRYLVVSCDSHAGPSLEHSLRAYCPEKYLGDFDAFANAVRTNSWEGMEDHLSPPDKVFLDIVRSYPEHRDTATECGGHDDFNVRLADMDGQGIAAEVIFAGGQNGEFLPFVGAGWDAGPVGVARELRQVGEDIWNRWLSDQVAVAPERLLGVIQIPIWDVEEAISTIRRGRAAGLRVVNMPAPRSDLTPYNDPSYDRLWSVCEELDIPLATHTASNETPMGWIGAEGKMLPGGSYIYAYEKKWLARRHIWQMIFGGVFDRHPKLRLVLTEAFGNEWLARTLTDLDNAYDIKWPSILSERPRRRPSEYWETNFFNSGSFLARHEVAMRNEVGVRNQMWGSDYPHNEGTWPVTLLALRNTFFDVPEDETRLILGENALGVYALDRDLLREVADRIGPTPEQVREPVVEGEIPAWNLSAGMAFRTFENF